MKTPEQREFLRAVVYSVPIVIPPGVEAERAIVRRAWHCIECDRLVDLAESTKGVLHVKTHRETDSDYDCPSSGAVVGVG